MSKRTISIVLIALVGAALAGVGAYFALRDRFAAPPPRQETKNHSGDTPATDDGPDDPSLYKAAPVSLSPVIANKNLPRRRAAVVRGRLLGQDGKPLEKIKVSVAGQSPTGQTLTGADGAFDLAVSGGGPLVVVCGSKGFLPVRRQVVVPWQDYVVLPDVVLARAPARAGVLELPLLPAADGAAPAVRGERVPDDVPRQATFLAPPGLTTGIAYSVGFAPLKGKLSLGVREYAAGSHGAAALPAPPPPDAGCAYAFELVVEEASQSGGRGAVFNPSLIHYVENFLKLPTGTELPTYRYDSDAEPPRWVAGPKGRVVRVEDLTKGLNDPVQGPEGEKKEEPPSTGDGPSLAERKAVGKLYAADQTLWRLPLTQTGSWAVFFPRRPPDGAAAPPWGLVSVTADASDAPRPQPAAESVAVAGTDFQLCYGSDRAPGTKAPFQLHVALSGPEVPKGLKRIDLEIQIAGVCRVESFPPAVNQQFLFDWDGLDGYGRPAPGRRPATVRVGYVYDGLPPASQECALWREQRVMLGGWDARNDALGGWTLNVHHAYDPVGRILYMGGGGRREAARLPWVVSTVAGGTGVPDYKEEDQQAILANLNVPRGLAAEPDGSLDVADAGQNKVRRVKPDGLIATAAGTTLAPLNEPTGLALSSDGSLYIADSGSGRVLRLRGRELQSFAGGLAQKGEFHKEAVTAAEARLSHLRGLALGPFGDVFLTQNLNNQCVCRVDANGIISFFLGGPNDPTKLRAAVDVVAAPDGTVYAADADGCRVWRVGPDGAVSAAAGTGTPGFSGDGGPAVKAELNAPSGLALGPDGSFYIADAHNGRVRRVAPDGVITTIAGRGASGTHDTGDGGPALEAGLALYLQHKQGDVAGLVGVAVGADGDLYVSDVGHGSVRRISPAFDGISDSEILIPSEDGKVLYVFDGVGRHLKTLDAATGTLIYRFVYDATWRLKEIHDGAGAVTKVERKGGRPVALVAPGGERTTLETGAESRLSRIESPGGETVEMEYDAGGLLTSFKDGQGRVTRFRYTDDGRLKVE